MQFVSPLLAILVAAVLNMLVGTVWYMPQVFGNIWLKEVHLKKDKITKESMLTAMVASFVCYIVTGFVLFELMRAFHPATIVDVLRVIFWLWLGFIAAVRLSHSLFEQRSMTYFWISSLHDFVSILVMGVVFWLWK
jgi:hypothetical protein